MAATSVILNTNMSRSTNASESNRCLDEPFDMITYAARVPIMMPLVAFSLAANTMNIVIFKHSSMNSTVINWYLTTLSCVDLLVSLCSFFMLSVPVIAEDFDSLFLFTAAAYVQRWTYAIAMIAQTASVLITTLASGFKFLGVCYPFLAKLICTESRIKSSIVLTVFFSITFNSSRWLELETEWCASEVYNGTGVHVIGSNLRSTAAYYTGFMLAGYTVIMFLLPFSLLIYMNAMIISTIQASNLMRIGMMVSKQSSNADCYHSASNTRTSSTANSPRLRTHYGRTDKLLNGTGICSNNQEPFEQIDNHVSPKISWGRESSVKKAKHVHKINLDGRKEARIKSSETNWSRLAIKSRSNRCSFIKTIRRVKRCESTSTPINEYHAKQVVKENRTTVMLVVVVILFLICNCLVFVNYVIEMILSVRSTEIMQEIYSVSVEVSNCLVVLGSSCNCLIYSAFSPKFRRLLLLYISFKRIDIISSKRRDNYSSKDVRQRMQKMNSGSSSREIDKLNSGLLLRLDTGSMDAPSTFQSSSSNV